MPFRFDRNDIPIAAALTFLTFVIVSSLAGCSSTPRGDFATAQSTYNAAVQTLNANHYRFSDETWDEDVLPLIVAGDAALDQYDVLTSSGLDPDSARVTLQQVLQALVVFLEQVEE